MELFYIRPFFEKNSSFSHFSKRTILWKQIIFGTVLFKIIDYRTVLFETLQKRTVLFEIRNYRTVLFEIWYYRTVLFVTLQKRTVLFEIQNYRTVPSFYCVFLELFCFPKQNCSFSLKEQFLVVLFLNLAKSSSFSWKKNCSFPTVPMSQITNTYYISYNPEKYKLRKPLAFSGTLVTTGAWFVILFIWLLLPSN